VLVNKRQLIKQRCGQHFDHIVIFRTPFREGQEWRGAGNLAAFRLLKLANRPDQITIQAWPLPEILFGNGLQERCGVASSFTVDEGVRRRGACPGEWPDVPW
jgi:hypothetical protein